MRGVLLLHFQEKNGVVPALGHGDTESHTVVKETKEL